MDASAYNGYFTGTYTLSSEIIGTAPSDDYSADINTTGRLEVGGSASGNLELYGDHDWFAITLEAGATYQFDQAGPSDAFPVSYTHLTLPTNREV